MKVLLVEDDEQLAEVLSASLRQQRYTVELAVDGLEGWDLGQSVDPDVMIVDVELPRLDGISLCKRLRSQGISTPILLLTSRDTDEDKVRGLDAGADDYLVKPCSLVELTARLRALMRRGREAQPVALTWGRLRLDPSTCEVVYGDTPVTLRPKEYSLLELFMRNTQRVFSRTAILDHLWALDDPPNEDTIKSHIKGLRRNLKAAGAPADLIESVYGLGYRLNPELPQTPVSTPISDEAKLLAVRSLAQAWPRFKPKMLERVALIARAIQAWERGNRDEDLRQQARQAAHKLAGALGTLGFPQGTELSRRLEQRILEVGLAGAGPLVEALQQELEQDPSFTVAIPAALLGPRLVTIAGLRLLLIGTDAESTERLLADAQTWQIQIEHAATLAQGREKLHQFRPDVVLVDLAGILDGIALLEDLRQRALPTLVIAAEGTLAERVAVARVGGKGVLNRPLLSEQVFRVVQRIQRQLDPGGISILAVDDDPQMLSLFEEMLRPWGFSLTTVTDPQLTWDVLQSSQPDLVVLNVDMPYYNGIELCQTIRNDAQYGDLPVLFLTAHRDPETIRQIFTAGADDYVNKPVIGPELIARILNRLERLHRT